MDVLSIALRDAPVEESDEDKPGVILDYDNPKPLAETGRVATLQNSNRTWAATVSRPPSARIRTTARLAALCWGAAGWRGIEGRWYQADR